MVSPELGGTPHPWSVGEAFSIAWERFKRFWPILIAVDVVHAAASGDPGSIQVQQQRWSQNGRDIAALLSSVNPNLSRPLLEQMLQKHLDLTTKEAVSRLHGDWASDVAAYDEGHDHMLMFSDALADAISKQFSGSERGTYTRQAA